MQDLIAKHNYESARVTLRDSSQSTIYNAECSLWVKSRHMQRKTLCPPWANSGHWQCSGHVCCFGL